MDAKQADVHDLSFAQFILLYFIFYQWECTGKLHSSWLVRFSAAPPDLPLHVFLIGKRWKWATLHAFFFPLNESCNSQAAEFWLSAILYSFSLLPGNDNFNPFQLPFQSSITLNSVQPPAPVRAFRFLWSSQSKVTSIYEHAHEEKRKEKSWEDTHASLTSTRCPICLCLSIISHYVILCF